MDVANRLYNRFTGGGIPSLLAGYMTAQSAHETGGWTSPIFLECNNCFGYKWIGQSTAAGPCYSHPSYAAYYTIEQSADELIKWIQRRQRDGSFPQNLNSITSPDQYATLLKNAGYYEDSLSTYANGLRAWLSQLSLTEKVGGGIGILLIGGLLFYAYRKKIFN